MCYYLLDFMYSCCIDYFSFDTCDIFWNSVALLDYFVDAVCIVSIIGNEEFVDGIAMKTLTGKMDLVFIKLAFKTYK